LQSNTAQSASVIRKLAAWYTGGERDLIYLRYKGGEKALIVMMKGFLYACCMQADKYLS
jgi:hypothetical protein